ncbi:hypothetical protein MBLNU230_g0740t1 [Neophaeotheca triangularis]
MLSFFLLLTFLSHLSQCLAVSSGSDSSRPLPFDEAVDNGTYGYYPTNTHASNTKVRSPQVNWLTWHEECDDGLLYFITPRGWSLPRPGPMILDAKGEMIWSKHFDNDFGGQAYDLQVQTYKGEQYLTFWLGDDRIRGHGSGSYYMLNASYDIVYQVGAVNGLSADLHEFLITPEGTALMTMYEIVPSPSDLSEFRKFDEEKNKNDKEPNWIWDCLFQEVDIETGDLIFQWRASEYVNISDTWHNVGQDGNRKDPFDWFHINSVEKDDLGNYLISARYPHSITYIDGKSGEVIWILGGKSNAFMDLSGGSSIDFAWQHDARFMPAEAFKDVYTPPEKRSGYETRLISFFDNAAEDQHYEYGLAYSRGLLLEVTYPTSPTDAAPGPIRADLGLEKRNDDLNAAKVALINGTNPDYKVRVIMSYENPQTIRSSSQGSMQLLHHNNPTTTQFPRVLVGYGLNAVLTEYAINGTVVCDAHFGARTSWERGDIQSYRAYKAAWKGLPNTPPKAVLEETLPGQTTIHTSWNGATGIHSWLLQSSSDGHTWENLETVPKTTFETTFHLSPSSVSSSRYLRALALDLASQPLAPNGFSNVIDRGLLISYLPGLQRTLPSALVGGPAVVKSLAVVVCGAMVGLGVFWLFRAVLVWRLGRGGGGAFRWRGVGLAGLGGLGVSGRSGRGGSGSWGWSEAEGGREKVVKGGVGVREGLLGR